MGRASRRKAERARSVFLPEEAVVGSPVFRVWPLPALLLIIVAAVLIYSNTFSVPFQFDDESNIIDNPQIRDLANFLNLSGTRYVGFLTFALNYRFGGLNVFGYHLVNLLIHITNGFLVYWLVLLLFQTSPPSPLLTKERGARGEVSRPAGIALAAALLFVAHPIQTQAVTYIVQRFASLVTLFYLLSVVCYLKWRLNHISPHPPLNLRGGARGSYVAWYLASLLSCLVAMKTKENSFTLPLMISLVEMVFFKPFRWKAIIPFFILAVPIIPLSHQDALGEAEGFARDTTEIGRLDYLFTQFRVIVTYLRSLVLPIHQNLDYDYPVSHSLLAPPVLASFLFLLFLLGLAVYFLRRARLIAFGIFWFFLTLSIESSIIPIKDVIFEHRLYLPSVGFFLVTSLIATWGWERWERMRVPVVVTGLLLLGGLSFAAYQRNLVWKDKIALWQDVVNKAPQKPRGHYDLGLAYQEGGMFDKAIESYQNTLKFKPDYGDAYNNLGNIYKAQGRPDSIDKAIKAYNQAFTVEPDHAEAYNNLGNIYTTQGRLEEAIRLYEKALELKPTYAEAYNNLGIAYTTQGRLDGAIEVYRKALSLQGDLDRTHFNLGNTYVKGGRFKEAIREYQAAVALKPAEASYHYALGNACLDAGQPNEATLAYEAAVRVKPDFAEAHFALGNTYAGQNRMKEARQAYETALRVKPDFAEVHNNLGNIHTLEGRFEEAAREYRKALEIKPDYAEASRNLQVTSQKLRRSH